jgi:WD40 repeat protein
VVELAHEALLRQWPRLAGWIDEDRDAIRVQRSLAVAAEEWARLERDDGALLRGARLGEAVELRDSGRAMLDECERALLAASEAAGTRERATRRRRLALAACATVVLVVAGAALAITTHFAGRERAHASSRDVAAQSAAVIGSDPRLALKLARIALQRQDTPQAQAAFRQATLADRTTAIVPVGSRSIDVVDVSPDGRNVVMAGEDGAIRLWRIGSNSSGRILTRHGAPVYGAAFTTDGRAVASTSTDGDVALTPVRGGERKRILHLPRGEYGVSVDASRHALVVETSASALWMVPLHGGRPYILGHAPGSQPVAGRLTINAAGTKVVTVLGDARAAVWDVAARTAKMLRPRPVLVASVSPGGSRVAMADPQGRITLADTETGAPIGRMQRVSDTLLLSLRFSPDGRRVVTAATDGVVRVTDLVSGQAVSELRGGRAGYADFVLGGRSIVSTGSERGLRIWSPLAVTVPDAPLVPSFAFFGRDSTRVFSNADDNAVHVWSPGTGQRALSAHHDVSGIASPSADGRWLVSLMPSGTQARIYDLGSGSSRVVRLVGAVASALAIDGRGRIAFGAARIKLQDRDGGHPTTLGSARDGGADELEFSRDGTQLASASGATVRLWNLRTGKAERTFEGETVMIRSLAYDSEGSRLATAGEDGTVRIWPLAGGAPLLLVGHDGPVSSARFNVRGDRVVSAGADGTVRIWDARSGHALFVLQRQPGSAWGAEFSPDGRSILSFGEGGMRITPCEVCGAFDEVAKVARTRVDRDITKTEREQLVDPWM